MTGIYLHVDSPEQVVDALRRASESYREKSETRKLSSEDDGDGKLWRELSNVLKRAADSCERAVARNGG